MASHRLQQINESIQRELSRALVTEFELSTDFLVTMIAVDTSADLQNATVWMSVLPESQKDRALRVIRHHAKELHAVIFRRVRFRPVPTLHFRYDATEARASKIEDLINQLPKS